MTTTVRRASADDYPWIIGLIDSNRGTGLTAQERGNRGFVQGEWSIAVLEDLADGPGIFVAEVDGRLAGFAITSPAGRITSGPAGRTNDLAAAAYPQGSFFLYGPVAVDDAARRRGVLRALVERLSAELGARYARAIAFVEGSNAASMAVHTRLGFQEFASFELDGRLFRTLSLSISGPGVVPLRAPA